MPEKKEQIESLVNPDIKKEYETWVEKKIFDISQEFKINFIRIKTEFNYATEIDKNLVAEIFVDETYHVACMKVYHAGLKLYREDKKMLIDCLCHELTHIHTNKLSQLAKSRYTTKDAINEAAEDLTETMAEYIRELIQLKNRSIYKIN